MSYMEQKMDEQIEAGMHEREACYNRISELESQLKEAIDLITYSWQEIATILRRNEVYIDQLEAEKKELIEAYEDYLNLIGEELSELMPIASVHGWKSTRHKEGKKMRKIIQEAAKPNN